MQAKYNFNYIYVIINVSISAVGFLRSYLFMKYLGLYDLGILTVIQTILMFIGLLQFGLINGGFRLVSLNMNEQNKKINNLIFTYFGFISTCLGVLWVLISIFGKWTILPNVFTLAAFLIGILTLIVNWLTNTLIGRQQIHELNRINVISGFIGLFSLPVVFYYGLNGAIFCLFTQPFSFILIVLYRNIDLRPSAIIWNMKLVTYLLSFGFIPFLSGIFGIINLQIERWFILANLGTESLGKFYLVFLYSSLFVIIPSSINSLFFPKAMLLYNEGLYSNLKVLIKQYYQLLLGYYVFVIVSTFFFLKFFISQFIPNHIYGVSLVYIIIPGLIFSTLGDPLGLLFNAAFKLKIILYGCLISTIINLLGMLFLVYSNMFSLENVSLLRTIVYFSLISTYFIFYYLERYNLWQKSCLNFKRQ